MVFDNYIKCDCWKPTDSLIMEQTALDVIKSIENSIVIAGPGSGKTELLAQRACYLLQTNTCNNPKNILAISFKKDAAKNLSERVKKRCSNSLSNRFESLTYDSFAKSIVDRFIDSIPKTYRPDSDYKIATKDDLINAFRIIGIPHSNYSTDVIKKITTEKLPIDLNNKIQLKLWILLLHGDLSNDFSPKINFPMISRLAEYIIRENPLIKKALQMTYSHVFLDEFQDTTDIQYCLIKEFFIGSKVIITAVGDSKQRIMVWAGALKTIFEDFKNDFNANESKLIMNYRSVPKLVEFQKLLYSNFSESNSNIQTCPKFNNLDGEINFRIFSDNISEAKIISNEIKKLIDSGIYLNDICIIVKQNAQSYSIELIENLRKVGLLCRDESEYQDLLKEDVLKIIISIFYLLSEDKNAEAWSYIISILISVKFIDSSKDFDKIYELQNDFGSFLENSKNKLNDITSLDDFKIFIGEILGYINIDSIKSMFPQYKRGNYLDDLVKKAISFIWKEFQSTSNWLNAIKNFEGLNSIPVMTIHKSKGLEYEAVFFIGLEDSAFWNFKNQSTEDRCAFFVALSRAKKRIDFTFCKNRPTRYTTGQTMSEIKEFKELLVNSKLVTKMDHTKKHIKI